LFRPLDDVNPDLSLARLEAEIMEEANKLGVGTMGFGGAVSLIGCKITAANRLPASFFVSVAYDCWAFRRLGVMLDPTTGAITKWLYRDPSRPVERLMAGAGFQVSGREIRLEPPLSEEKVRALKVGDVVLINGPMITARDAAHAYLMHHDAPCDLNGAILYHCGPVMMKDGANWRTVAAGPTTSIREEPYEADIIKRFHVRAVMGKGGMGKKTLAALKEFGAVYLHAIGGAAQFYARRLPKVHAVYLLEELGVPEAMWVFEARDFLAIVTMDSHGNSLHEEVAATTGAELEKMGTRV
jgi:fumarate hydratase class I